MMAFVFRAGAKWHANKAIAGIPQNAINDEGFIVEKNKNKNTCIKHFPK